VSKVAAALVAAENRRLDALADALAERARGDAAFAGVACAVESPQLTYRDLLVAFRNQARVHDLSLLDAEKNTIDIDRDLIETVLFESGRPVLVVPAGRDAFVARRVIVAWDGSAMAARAVGDAMAFLRAADEVEVVSVLGEKDLSQSVQGAELAPHLARHGVNVSVKDLTVARNGGVAETLCDQAGLFRADMMVMGAFKHSRLREWVLGGVTQSLLKSTPVPLLMSH
jgi:nucleotide-binding universal stress UspA family protein